MKRAVEILFLIALACFSFACVCIGLAVHKEAAKLDVTLDNADRVLVSIGGVSADLRKIADGVKNQMDAQTESVAQTTKNLTRTSQALAVDLEHLTIVIDHADAMVVHLDANATLLGQQATLTLDDARDAIADVKPALQAATDTLQGTAKLTNDPELEALLSRASDTTAHLDATAASVDRDAQMLETRLRQALKPASLAKRIFLWVLQYVPPIATAAK